ncbi:MAG: ribonuclease HI [Clostridia bacterium]|nr:ribonuclease HI [Clostridia bacterium]
MKRSLYDMIIEAKINSSFLIALKDEATSCYVLYNSVQKDLIFLEETPLSKVFKKNEYQLRKMLHNKRPDTYFIGFHLQFVFMEGKNIASYNDRNKIIVLDKREKPYKNYVLDQGMENIFKLYTDASFLEGHNKGGIAFIIENPLGEYELFHEVVKGNSSNLLELYAAIKGLEHLRDQDCIRIITDSQYVRKGLTEWIPCWELNNWMTVNGEKAKNIEVWQYFNSLSEHKYIEFQWVKAHNNHFENTLCDLYAKEAIKND